MIIIIKNNQLQLFEKLIKNKPIDNNKYIFLVEDIKLQESIISFGYFSLSLVESNDFEDFLNSLNNNLIGTYINEFIFLPMMTKIKNDEFYLKFDKYLKIDKKSWTITKDREFYLANNYKEFESVLKNYIDKLDKEPVLADHGFETEKGKIKAKNLDRENFAKYLANKYSIVKIDKSLHFYDSKENYYPCLTTDNYNSIIMQEVYNTSISQRREYYPYLLENAIIKNLSSENYILFNNGIYDLKEDILLPLSNEYVIQNKIYHNYTTEHSKSAIDFADKFLLALANNDLEVSTLLKQIIGYNMYRKNSLGKMFFLRGSGGNGKSTFFKLLDYIFNKENIAYKEVEDLSKEYNLIGLKGKVLTICDDVDNGYIPKTNILKKLVTGEIVNARNLYSAPEEFAYKGKILLAGNEIPRMNDKSNGMGRRLEIIPFDADFTSNPDINIEDKLLTEEVAERLIYLGIQGLKEVLTNKSFIKCKVVEQAKEDYHTMNDNVKEFVQEHKDLFSTKSANEIFEEYKRFCRDCLYTPYSRKGFYQAVEKEGWYKPDKPILVNGKTMRIFLPKTFK